MSGTVPERWKMNIFRIIFCKTKGMVWFNDHFPVLFHFILSFIFEKNGIKMKSKMSQKWLKNDYCERPYLGVMARKCTSMRNFFRQKNTGWNWPQQGKKIITSIPTSALPLSETHPLSLSKPTPNSSWTYDSIAAACSIDNHQKGGQNRCHQCSG